MGTKKQSKFKEDTLTYIEHIEFNNHSNYGVYTFACIQMSQFVSLHHNYLYLYMTLFKNDTPLTDEIVKKELIDRGVSSSDILVTYVPKGQNQPTTLDVMGTSSKRNYIGKELDKEKMRVDISYKSKDVETLNHIANTYLLNGSYPQSKMEGELLFDNVISSLPSDYVKCGLNSYLCNPYQKSELGIVIFDEITPYSEAADVLTDYYNYMAYVEGEMHIVDGYRSIYTKLNPLLRDWWRNGTIKAENIRKIVSLKGLNLQMDYDHFNQPYDGDKNLQDKLGISRSADIFTENIILHYDELKTKLITRTKKRVVVEEPKLNKEVPCKLNDLMYATSDFKKTLIWLVAKIQGEERVAQEQEEGMKYKIIERRVGIEVEDALRAERIPLYMQRIAKDYYPMMYIPEGKEGFFTETNEYIDMPLKVLRRYRETGNLIKIPEEIVFKQKIQAAKYALMKSDNVIVKVLYDKDEDWNVTDIRAVREYQEPLGNMPKIM